MSVESDEVRYYRELDREEALERAIENRVEDLLKEAAGMAELARQKEDAILEIVNAKI